MSNRYFPLPVITTAIFGVWVFSAAGLSVQGTPTSTQTPAEAVPLSGPVEEILKLSRARVNDDVTVAFIDHNPAGYKLNAGEILYLRTQGVSDRVLTAMLNHTSTAKAQQPAAAPPTLAPGGSVPNYAPQDSTVYQPAPTTTYAADSYPYYYASYPYYYGYSYPGVSVGFSFGYGCGYYGYPYYGYCGYRYPYSCGYRYPYYGHYGHYGHGYNSVIYNNGTTGARPVGSGVNRYPAGSVGRSNFAGGGGRSSITGVSQPTMAGVNRPTMGGVSRPTGGGMVSATSFSQPTFGGGGRGGMGGGSMSRASGGGGMSRGSLGGGGGRGGGGGGGRR